MGVCGIKIKKYSTYTNGKSVDQIELFGMPLKTFLVIIGGAVAAIVIIVLGVYFISTSDRVAKNSIANGKYIIGLSNATWYKANAYCHSIGMNLIDISTQEKQDEVVDFINHAGHEKASFWTSGIYIMGSNKFYWFNSGKEYDFTNWATDRPESPNVAQCMLLSAPMNFQWDNTHCEYKRRFICEKSAPKKTNEITNGKYHITTVTANWYKANAFCHSVGMNLIEVSTREKQNAVRKMIIDNHSTYRTFWTSGTSLGGDDFYWFNTGKNYNFTFWQSGEPNSLGGNQKCMTLRSGYRLKWDDDSCASEYRVMCETSD